MKQEHYVVEYGRHVIDFTLQFSERKTVAISVQPDCQVVVTAPKGADLSRVLRLVHKRARWIQKQQLYFQQFLPRTPLRKFVGGETHLYLGRRYRLKLLNADQPSLKLSGGYFVIRHSDISTPENIEKVLYCWYRSRAVQKFKERFELCLSNFSQKHAIEVPELHIRRMKSRWGSYAPSGRLALNLELIKAPVDCIDYVITHELCHVVHADHETQFYGLLVSVMPDYLSKKLKLEQYLS